MGDILMVTRNPETPDGAPGEGRPVREVVPPGRIPFAELALSGVYEISKLLTMPHRLEVTLANVVSVLSSFLDMRRGMIVMLEDEGEPEIVATGGGWSSESERAPPLPQGAIDQIVATATPLVVEDIAKHPLFARSGYLASAKPGVRVSFVGVPIKVADKVRGTLSIDRIWDGKADFRFDHDVRFLTMVASLVGQAVRMQVMVSTDRERMIAEQHRLEKELGRAHVPTPVLKPVRGGKPGKDAAPAGIVGESPALRRVIEQVRLVAKLNTAVLLRGETGTGKELFAKAIHDGSPRAKAAFVKLNCAALPESVIESELFGHEKGAFTSAISQRKGRFELADGGTIFLDEIGEISPAFQAKLLRVLQEGEFERVGGTTTLKSDARLVCATNRNLEEMVAAGTFRADLYYRINVITIQLPPLRERPGDIPKLAQTFLERFNTENGRDLAFEPGAVDVLAHCYFPGNVRELENCVRRTASLAQGERVTLQDLACHQGACLSATLWKGRGHANVGVNQILPVGVLTREATQPTPNTQTSLTPAFPAPAFPAPAFSTPASEAAPYSAEPPNLEAPPPCCGDPDNCSDKDRCGSRRGPTEKQKLIGAMEKAGWVQAKAARLLGLTPRQIGYALRKHGIEVEKL